MFLSPAEALTLSARAPLRLHIRINMHRYYFLSHLDAVVMVVVGDKDCQKPGGLGLAHIHAENNCCTPGASVPLDGRLPEQVARNRTEQVGRGTLILQTPAHDDGRRHLRFVDRPVCHAVRPQTPHAFGDETHANLRGDESKRSLQFPHFMNGGRLDGMIAERAELLVRVTRTRRRRIDDQRFLRQRVERQPGRVGERMTGGQCRDQVFLT